MTICQLCKKKLSVCDYGVHIIACDCASIVHHSCYDVSVQSGQRYKCVNCERVGCLFTDIYNMYYIMPACIRKNCCS